MFERYTLIGLVFSAIIILIDFYLLKKRKIKGKMFVFWFMIGAILGLFSMGSPLIYIIPTIFGTEFTISGILATGFLFFLLAIFYLHYKITELHSLLMKLAMEISVTKYSQKQKSKKETKRKLDA